MKKRLVATFVLVAVVLQLAGCNENKEISSDGTKRAIEEGVTKVLHEENNRNAAVEETKEKATKSIESASVSEEYMLEVYDDIQEITFDIYITYYLLSYNITSYAGIGKFCGDMAECLDKKLPELREIYQKTKEIPELKEVNLKIKKVIELSPTKYTGSDVSGMQNYFYHYRDFYNELLDTGSKMGSILEEYGVVYYDLYEFKKMD